MPTDQRYDMLNNTDRDEAIRLMKIKQGLIPDTESEAYQREKEEREKLLLSSANVLKAAYSDLNIYDMKGILDNIFLLGVEKTTNDRIFGKETKE